MVRRVSVTTNRNSVPAKSKKRLVKKQIKKQSHLCSKCGQSNWKGWTIKHGKVYCRTCARKVK